MSFECQNSNFMVITELKIRKTHGQKDELPRKIKKFALMNYTFIHGITS